MTDRDKLIIAIARLVNGLGVPVSLGMPLGTAREAYVDTRHLIHDFGWSSVEEIETKLRAVLG